MHRTGTQATVSHRSRQCMHVDRPRRDIHFQHKCLKSCTRHVQTHTVRSWHTRESNTYTHTSKITNSKRYSGKREKHKAITGWVERTHTHYDRESPQQLCTQSEGHEAHQELQIHTTSLVAFTYQTINKWDKCKWTNWHIHMIWPVTSSTERQRQATVRHS